MRKESIYAVYKGDKFIDLGTKKELAKRLNVKPEFIGYLTTPVNRRRIAKTKTGMDNRLIAIKIEDEEKESDVK